MIDLSEVGAFVSTDTGGIIQIRFGVYLPGIRATDGFEVVVRIIHRDDRFVPGINPQDSSLSWTANHPLDLWTANVPIQAVANTNFGQPGVYLYRFQLWWNAPLGERSLITLCFTDPFALQTDIGLLSAVNVPHPSGTFAWTDANYKTPELDD